MKQQPLGTGYSAKTEAEDLIRGIDLRGTTVIITGGYAGIGLETVSVLSQAGAEVWAPARDMAKAEKALTGVMGRSGDAGSVILRPLDLMDPKSIDAFAAEFLAAGKPLDLLINNAGIMWVPLRRDAQGNESQLSTNHLGHFRLTARLWPALKAAARVPEGAGEGGAVTGGGTGMNAGGARVVNVSSFGHQIAPFDFDDPNFERRGYESLNGYGQSKTANNLFTIELDRRGAEFGVRAYAVHPGAVNGTDLGREAPMELFIQMGTHDVSGKIKPDVEARLKTVAQGAATTVWCAVSPMLNAVGGVYCEDGDIAELDEGQIEHRYDDPASLRGVRPYSVDEGNARRLWEWTEARTGVKFPVN